MVARICEKPGGPTPPPPRHGAGYIRHTNEAIDTKLSVPFGASILHLTYVQIKISHLPLVGRKCHVRSLLMQNKGLQELPYWTTF